nr:hypothetical protein CFP56_10120 [Quercus suber]
MLRSYEVVITMLAKSDVSVHYAAVISTKLAIFFIPPVCSGPLRDVCTYILFWKKDGHSAGISKTDGSASEISSDLFAGEQENSYSSTVFFNT